MSTPRNLQSFFSDSFTNRLVLMFAAACEHYFLADDSNLAVMFLLVIPVVSFVYGLVIVCGGVLVAVVVPQIDVHYLGASFLTWLVAVSLVLFLSRKLIALPNVDAEEKSAFKSHGHTYRNLLLGVWAILALRLIVFTSVPVLPYVAWLLILGLFLKAVNWPPPRVQLTWTQRLANWALLVVSLVLSLGAVELVARKAFPVPYLEQPSRGVFEAHPRYLWTLKRDAEHEYKLRQNGEVKATFVVKTSSQGLRDRFFGPKESDEYRILMLGDSLTLGWGLNVEDTIPRALEGLLASQETSKRITVINAGVAGYGPWQERGFLKERGWGLDPDLVILQLFPINDVENSLVKVGKWPQAFDASWAEIVTYWMFDAHWRMQIDWLLRTYCRTYDQLKAAAHSQWSPGLALRNVRFFEELKVPKLPEPVARPGHIEIDLEEWYPVLEEGWQIFKSDVLAIRKDCEAHGVEFLSYVLPGMSELYDEHWSETIQYAKEPRRYERFKGIRLCEEFTKANGIPYLDVADILLAHSRETNYAHLHEGHLNVRGCELVAARLAEHLMTQVLQ